MAAAASDSDTIQAREPESHTVTGTVAPGRGLGLRLGVGQEARPGPRLNEPIIITIGADTQEKPHGAASSPGTSSAAGTTSASAASHTSHTVADGPPAGTSIGIVGILQPAAW